MAKNSLCLWVQAKWLDHPKVVEAREAGHTIVSMDDWEDMAVQRPDRIFHEAATVWNDTMWPYFDIALKSARRYKKELENASPA